MKRPETIFAGAYGCGRSGAYRNREGSLAGIVAVAMLHPGGVVRLAVGADRFVVPPCFLKMGDTVLLGGKLLEYLCDVYGSFLLSSVGNERRIRVTTYL